MKTALGVVSIVLVLGLVTLGVYTASLVSKLGEQQADAQELKKKVDAADEGLSEAKEAAETARAERDARAEELAEVRGELASAKKETEAAKAAQEELLARVEEIEAHLEAGLENLEEPPQEEETETDDIENKPMMEVMKEMFSQDIMKTALDMMIPLRLKQEFGGFLDEHVTSAEQRARAEEAITDVLKFEMSQMQEAFAAWPDTSKLEELDSQEQLTRDMMVAALSNVLNPGQLSAFEEYYDERNRHVEEWGLNMVAEMAGLELDEEQSAAFKKIIKEEQGVGRDFAGGPTQDLDRLSTMTVGAYIESERQRIERTVQQLHTVLPPEQVERYRAFAENQLEMMRMQLNMYRGGEKGSR